MAGLRTVAAFEADHLARIASLAPDITGRHGSSTIRRLVLPVGSRAVSCAVGRARALRPS
jgi:hypothetical protein